MPLSNLSSLWVYHYHGKERWACEDHKPATGVRTNWDQARGHECWRCAQIRHQKRNQYRHTVCAGCRSNRYNFKSNGERPGIDAPTDGEGCWSLDSISHGVCPAYQR